LHSISIVGIAFEEFLSIDPADYQSHWRTGLARFLNEAPTEGMETLVAIRFVLGGAFCLQDYQIPPSRQKLMNVRVVPVRFEGGARFGERGHVPAQGIAGGVGNIADHEGHVVGIDAAVADDEYGARRAIVDEIGNITPAVPDHRLHRRTITYGEHENDNQKCQSKRALLHRANFALFALPQT